MLLFIFNAFIINNLITFQVQIHLNWLYLFTPCRGDKLLNTLKINRMLKKIFRLITSIFGSEISEFIGDADIDLGIDKDIRLGVSADQIENTIDAANIGVNTINKVTSPENKPDKKLDKRNSVADIVENKIPSKKQGFNLDKKQGFNLDKKQGFNLDKKQNRKYYYAKDSEHFGPFELSVLITKIDGNTLVWREGVEWNNANTFEELKEYFPEVVKTEAKPLAKKTDQDKEIYTTTKKAVNIPTSVPSPTGGSQKEANHFSQTNEKNNGSKKKGLRFVIGVILGTCIGIGSFIVYQNYSSSNSVETVVAAEEVIINYQYVISGKLHLCEAPGEKSMKLIALPFGTPVELLGDETRIEEYTYQRARVNGNNGWVSTKKDEIQLISSADKLEEINALISGSGAQDVLESMPAYAKYTLLAIEKNQGYEGIKVEIENNDGYPEIEFFRSKTGNRNSSSDRRKGINNGLKDMAVIVTYPDYSKSVLFVSFSKTYKWNIVLEIPIETYSVIGLERLKRRSSIQSQGVELENSIKFDAMAIRTNNGTDKYIYGREGRLQEIKAPLLDWNYIGTIGNIPIKAQINYQEAYIDYQYNEGNGANIIPITGYYFYESENIEIPLTGERYGYEIDLVAQASSNTEYFDGLTIGDGSVGVLEDLSGTWRKGNQSLNFVLYSAEKQYRIEDPDGYSNLRAAPNGDILLRVYDHEIFHIIGEESGFKKVKLNNGTEGYIHASRVVAY